MSFPTHLPLIDVDPLPTIFSSPPTSDSDPVTTSTSNPLTTSSTDSAPTSTETASPSQPFFQPSCPSGGNYYACDSETRFVGCCQNEPCGDGCRQGNLQPLSFEKEQYSNFPDLACDKGASFYTCKDSNPPFAGCCKVNPCDLGSCPTVELAPAYLPLNAAACVWRPGGCSTTTKSSTLSSATPTTTSGTPVPESSPATKSHVPLGPIIGGTIGGVFFILLCAFLGVWFYRRSKWKRVPSGAKEDLKIESPWTSPYAGMTIHKPRVIL